MAKVSNTITIAASPEAVWALLGNLSRAPEYVPGVVSATVDGLWRTCTDAQGNEIREEISDYSPQRRSYRFKHVSVPIPVRGSRGTFAVQEDGAGARVSMEWEFDLLDSTQAAALMPMLDGASKMTLDNLRKRVESGS
jgi:uncharacterized protein YndB with AHSA1/START domain